MIRAYSYVGNNPWTYVDPFGLQEVGYPWAGYNAGEFGLGLFTVPVLLVDGISHIGRSTFGGGAVRGCNRNDLDAYLMRVDAGDSQWAPILQGELANGVQEGARAVRDTGMGGAVALSGPAAVGIKFAGGATNASEGNYAVAALPVAMLGLRFCPAARRAAGEELEGAARALGQQRQLTRIADEIRDELVNGLDLQGELLIPERIGAVADMPRLTYRYFSTVLEARVASRVDYVVAANLTSVLSDQTWTGVSSMPQDS